jgi:hypothetical protein
MLGLSAYGSSSSSEDEGEGAATRPDAADLMPAKRPRLSSPRSPPPLPPPPLDEAADPVEALPDGRVRSFAHVEGDYAVHVYIPVRSDARLAACLRKCVAGLESSGAVHAVAPAELHLSLSRTAPLRRPQVDAFPDALRVALRSCTATRASLDVVSELCNDERNRYFAAAELPSRRPGYAEVCRMIDAVDQVMERYGLPRFYEERRVHFSFAWALAPLLPPAGAAGWTAAVGSLASCTLELDTVACRLGERVTSFKLAAPRRS